MKNLFFLFVLIALITCQARSQDFQINWQNCFGGSYKDVPEDVVKNADGGYMILGATESTDGDISFNHGSDDVWLVKTDSNGDMLWEKTYGGTNWDGGRCILKYNDNTYFILAVTQSSDGDITFDPYPGSPDYWIVKIDSNGNILWDKIYGGTWFDNILNGIVTNDGGLVAFGFTESDDGDISEFFGFRDWWMLKLDSLGNKEWDRSFGSTNADYGMAIIQTSDGGYLIGGSARVLDGGNILCDNIHEKVDAVLIKLDPYGNTEWQQCYGGSESEQIDALYEIDDGYILVSSTSSNDGDVSGLHGLAGLDYDIWLVKVDFEGNLLWQKCLGGTDSEFAENIFPTQNGGYQIVGSTESNDGDVSGNHSINDRSDIWIIEVDNAGNLLKQQCFGGVTNEIVWHGVHKHNDHRFVIAAETQGGPSYDVSCDFNDLGDSRYWVFEISDSTVGIQDEGIGSWGELGRMELYPNPATTELQLRFSILDFRSSIFIYDLYGRKQDELIIPKDQSQTRVDVSNYPSGVFIVVLNSVNGNLMRGKFVKR